jgi:hypothetical protein
VNTSKSGRATLPRQEVRPLTGWQRVAAILAVASVEVGVTLGTGSVEQGIAAVAPLVWVLR